MHHVRAAVKCPPKLVGTKQQEVWIKRGGIGHQSGSGPSGSKLKPARVLARSLANMARAHKPKGKDTK